MSTSVTPPRLSETPILGSFVPFTQDPPRFLHQVAQSHPTADLVHFTFLGINNYLILSPELVREVLVNRASEFPKSQRDYGILSKFLGDGLVTAEGEQHQRQRKLAQPAFHHKRITTYGNTMVDYTEDMVAKWQTGETRDMTHEMNQLTLYIVAKTLFNADKSHLVGAADKVGQAIHILQEVTDNDFRRPIQWPQWFPTADNRARQEAKGVLDEAIQMIVAERRQQETADKGDLLSMLLLARDDAGKGMDDTELRDQLVTIFVAGHETTSNALSWTWYLLSQNPAAEAKLHAELDEVLDGRLPSLADLPNLPYTQMVLKEAMRLYPPAWTLTGRTAATTTLGNYTLRQGADVMVVPYVLHRNPTIFPEPEQFNPERFTAEREKELPRYAYLPFGAGPRVCIGNSFAMMEAQLIIATVAQQFRLRLAAGQRVDLNAQITLSPLGGLPMVVEKRVHNHQPQAELRGELVY